MEELKKLYADILAREQYLKSQEQTAEVAAKLAEVNLAVVAIQGVLLKSLVLKTCKTCAYWSQSYKVKNQKSDCDFSKTITGEKTANALKFDVEASATDDSGLDYVVMTGENFGCVHHKQKK